MKNLILLIFCVLGVATTAQADGVTWGKEVLFPIKSIRYNGRVYSGALIASDVQRNNVSGVGSYLTIVNPRVLVYNVRFGLDEVFDLDFRPDTQNSFASALCLSLGKKHTQMHDVVSVRGPVAHFIRKDEVVIGHKANHYATKSFVSCSDFYVGRD